MARTPSSGATAASRRPCGLKPSAAILIVGDASTPRRRVAMSNPIINELLTQITGKFDPADLSLQIAADHLNAALKYLRRATRNRAGLDETLELDMRRLEAIVTAVTNEIGG